MYPTTTTHSIWMLATKFANFHPLFVEIGSHTSGIMVKFRLHGWLILMDKSWAKFPLIPQPDLFRDSQTQPRFWGRGTPAQHGTC